MKRGSTIFLQVVIALLGVGVLALLLWEPQVEGRNVNATQFEIYFKDPIPGVYIPGLRPIFCRSNPGIQNIRVFPTKRNIFPAFCASFADHQVLRINYGDLYSRGGSLFIHLYAW